jgi:sulfide:quinone oxidoreductase
MSPTFLTPDFAIAKQPVPGDLQALSTLGFRSIICNQADSDGGDQATQAEMRQAAEALGMHFFYLPTEVSTLSEETIKAFDVLLAEVPKPALSYCRSGTLSVMLWALSQVVNEGLAVVLERTKDTQVDISSIMFRLIERGKPETARGNSSHQIVIVGGGSAGIATAASLSARVPNLDIVIIDPADAHYYQPGWTMVGGGVFQASSTVKTMASVIPDGVKWIKDAVVAFQPEMNQILLQNGRTIAYQQLIVCPGLKLNWSGIKGLTETLGANGVTSNYRYDLAPYTWQLVQELKDGRALFTQPPMPIKCAGAPQKALYLACDYWRRNGRQSSISTQFYTAGGVLFGVADYVPALMEYVRKYEVDLRFNHKLIAVDGPAKLATFQRTNMDGVTDTLVVPFDLLHVVPPQIAPDFVRSSPLADESGWLNVDPATLTHRTFPNIHGLGDVTNTTNAKTMAAARKQAPVVANNVLVALGLRPALSMYDGYGSCPLTVERGKIVLAEFTYGGKVAPSFAPWLLNGLKPTRLAWFLKVHVLPRLYWHGMLKGHEWMAAPRISNHAND